MDDEQRELLQQRWDDLAGPVVRVEQAVQAPPAEVCVAWLNPERLASWWWPQFPDTTYEVDARAGGAFRFRSEQAGLAAHGTYLYLGPEDAPAIWMTWNWEGGGDGTAPEELVRVRFEEQEGFGTAVVLEHRLAKPGEDVDNPTQGWSDVMVRLA